MALRRIWPLTSTVTLVVGQIENRRIDIASDARLTEHSRALPCGGSLVLLLRSIPVEIIRLNPDVTHTAMQHMLRSGRRMPFTEW